MQSQGNGAKQRLPAQVGDNGVIDLKERTITLRARHNLRTVLSTRHSECSFWRCSLWVLPWKRSLPATHVGRLPHLNSRTGSNRPSPCVASRRVAKNRLCALATERRLGRHGKKDNQIAVEASEIGRGDGFTHGSMPM